jgi:hypothetical protein
LRFLLLYRGTTSESHEVTKHEARLRERGLLEHVERRSRVDPSAPTLAYGTSAARRTSRPGDVARAEPRRSETVASLRVLRADTVDEAIAHALAAPHGTGTVEVYPIVDPLEVPFGSSHPHESLGYAVHFVKPLPARAHTRSSRFLVTFEGMSLEEPPRRASLLEAGRTLFEMAARGVLVGGEGLRDCAARFRLERQGTRREWTTRVRVATRLFGYLVLRADSQEEAHEWAMACASLSGHQGGEIVELEACASATKSPGVTRGTKRPELPRP